MSKKQTVITLVIFSLLLYGLFLGLFPLLDPDEPVYGETAREMLLTGDWLSPRIYGDFWYDKPPLFYWLEAVSFSLFGISTWSARLPSALLGIGTVLYVFWSSCSLFGERVSRIAAFILASSLEIALLARSSVTDMTLVFTLTVALMSFLKKNYVTAYIFCGLALLAKGPIGFGFPALIVGLWLILTRRFTIRNILGLRWYWGIPLACLVGLPWFIYMGYVHGSAFIDTFLGYHNITRFVSPEHAGKDHIWLYIVVLIAGFFPWTGTLPGILRRINRWRHDPTLMYFIVWAGFIFIFFSLSSTQLFSYILPMFPPLAILAAKYLTELESEGHLSRAFLFSHALFLLVVSAAIALAPLTPVGGKLTHYAFALFLFLLGIGSIVFLRRGQFHRFYMAQGFVSLFLVLGTVFLFAEPISENFACARIGQRLEETSLEKGYPLYIDSFYRPSIAFYYHEYGRPLPDMTAEGEQRAAENQSQNVYLPGDSQKPLPDNAYILVQSKSYSRWPASAKKGLTLIWKQDTGCLFKKEAASL
jgi:4-amino-4-deoxy-L-arabinose transferase-like glycosyltransferase